LQGQHKKELEEELKNKEKLKEEIERLENEIK